jgi:nifR3 family TIM-barrel protein
MIGLAPMDGVTDAAFRFIVDTYGKPDILYTEFISIKGLQIGKPAIMRSLLKHQTTTPIVAQLFGNDPELFYQATLKVLKLGFDGVDINMGCPDQSVFNRGGGAALILKPDLAISIVKSVKKAVKDWGRKKMLVSVKTRTGYKTHQTREWIGRLLEGQPDVICIHGRTYAQKYLGKADWEQIALAGELARKTPTKIFGNGDIKSKQEALEKIRKYKLAGVLIGRAALGNPWIFQDKIPTFKEKIKVILDHSYQFTKFFPQGDFKAMRKHLVWYTKGFIGSAQVRNSLMKVNNIEEVESIFSSVFIK